MNVITNVEDRSLKQIKLITIPLVLILFFFGLSFTPRVQQSETLTLTFQIITGIFFLFYIGMLLISHRQQQGAEIKVILVKAHYVQMIMHLSIFIYWGWYWPQVYDQAVLILAQLIFVHIIDVLYRWTRGDAWLSGFGRFPIIFSTNLFLWFRDDWFYFQFIMIAFGVLAKEVFTWTLNNRKVHIFNPSAISLAVASILLIMTNNTPISWGSEISNTLAIPPYMYILIFMTGLVVQYLFHVTLVTLATAVTLLFAGAIYYQISGVYFFYTSDIPIAVFLGLHLLVTDPVTSPKTNFGRILFGIFYALSVMILFEVLDAFGAPTFYDKLLAVPLLNLTIQLLDRIARKIDFNKIFSAFSKLNAYQLNLIHMVIWILVFVSWYSSGRIGPDHPGRQSNFWETACDQELRNGCKNLFNLISIECEKGNALACAKLGSLYRRGRGVDRDDQQAYKLVDQACTMGLEEACDHLHEYLPE